MNTDSESITPDPSPQPASPKPGGHGRIQPKRSDARSAPNSDSHSRRNGNVARLPKAVRDQLNLMVQDGVPYAQIIQRLGDAGKTLSISNVSRWKDGGYKDWLLERTWLADTRARQESASDLSGDIEATQVNQAALQLGALHIFEALRQLGPGTLDEKLGGDSAAFSRFIHALARASRETLKLQEYRDEYEATRLAVQALGGLDKIFPLLRRNKPASTDDKPITDT
jgi:hypothetical protein